MALARCMQTDTLEQEWSLPLVTSRCGQLITQFTEKTHVLIIYWSEGFDRNWYKIVNCLDSLVLDMLEDRGLFRCCAWRAVIWRWDATSVSGRLTSYVTHLPIFSKEPTSFRLFSFRCFKNRPVGSLEAGTPDLIHARKIMSLNI